VRLTAQLGLHRLPGIDEDRHEDDRPDEVADDDREVQGVRIVPTSMPWRMASVKTNRKPITTAIEPAMAPPIARSRVEPLVQRLR
jgi:hypothetical protein